MNQTKQLYQVYGEIIVPIYVPVYCSSKQAAMDSVKTKISRKNVLKLDGNLHLLSGEQHPIIASKIRSNWLEVLGEEDL